MWACRVTDPPTASCYQPPDVALTFRLLGGRFNYGADISTVGWTFQLWGGCFDHGADISTVGRMFQLWGGRFDCGVDVSTAGCVYRHWDGRFYCIPTLYLDSLLYSQFFMYTSSLNIELNYKAEYLMQSSPRITGYNQSLTGYDRD